MVGYKRDRMNNDAPLSVPMAMPVLSLGKHEEELATEKKGTDGASSIEKLDLRDVPVAVASLMSTTPARENEGLQLQQALQVSQRIGYQEVKLEKCLVQHSNFKAPQQEPQGRRLLPMNEFFDVDDENISSARLKDALRYSEQVGRRECAIEREMVDYNNQEIEKLRLEQPYQQLRMDSEIVAEGLGGAVVDEAATAQVEG
jgi:hypothetical protein